MNKKNIFFIVALFALSFTGSAKELKIGDYTSLRKKVVLDLPTRDYAYEIECSNFKEVSEFGTGPISSESGVGLVTFDVTYKSYSCTLTFDSFDTTIIFLKVKAKYTKEQGDPWKFVDISIDKKKASKNKDNNVKVTSSFEKKYKEFAEGITSWQLSNAKDWSHDDKIREKFVAFEKLMKANNFGNMIIDHNDIPKKVNEWDR